MYMYSAYLSDVSNSRGGRFVGNGGTHDIYGKCAVSTAMFVPSTGALLCINKPSSDLDHLDFVRLVFAQKLPPKKFINKNHESTKYKDVQMAQTRMKLYTRQLIETSARL